MRGVSEANVAWKREAARRRQSQDLRLIPSRIGRDPVVSDLRVQIIGGNPLASGVETIQYAATVTPLAVYDPDVDTAYPVGLGNAWLWVNGVLQVNRVLARNRFAGDQSPWFSGRLLRVMGTETLSYGATAMTTYLAW